MTDPTPQTTTPTRDEAVRGHAPRRQFRSAIDFETADRLLTYVPETGDLLWRVRRGPKSKGTKAGCIRRDGYLYVVIGQRKFLAHRLCWLLHYGEWPSAHLDHINRDKVDNRLVNLRAATSAQNNLNRPKQSNNSSGFKGVWFHKKSGKYLAIIVFEGVKRQLGQFLTAEEASEAYQTAAKELHGEFFYHS